jgi:competence protein ComEA
MARQRALDPELAQLAAERLARVLDARALGGARPRRAVDESPTGEFGMGEFGTGESSMEGVSTAGTATRASPRRAGPELEEAAELPELRDLRDLPAPTRFSAWHVRVVVVLLLVGLCCAGWALLRARPVAMASPGDAVPAGTPVTPASTGSAAPSPGDASSGSTPVVSLVVHVLGAVRHPGLVDLPDRSRVQDALDAAGGLTRTADPGELNLAQLLTDGEQIVVGTRAKPRGEVREGSGSDQSAPGTTAGGVLDLNGATEAQLEELPGVGPVTAGKILAWRQEHHRFNRVAELQEVDGIGPKTYAQIAPHVRV